MTTRSFAIKISTDFPGAVEAVREATRKLAEEVGWGDDCTTSVEAVEVHGSGLWGGAPTYLAGYEMEPGDGDAGG